MLFGAGGFFFVLENKHFNPNGQIPDMIDAMYYVVITISTVGYGDISPKTVLGRIGAILLALCALIYIPIRVAQLVSIMQITSSGVVKRPGKHVIVSAASADDFEAFSNEYFHPDRSWTDTTLALLAPSSEVEQEIQTLSNRKAFEHRLEALQGSLSNPSFYPNYYLDSAKGVVLMADKNKGSMGDAVTLVTAMSLKQRYPDLPLYIQVQSKSSKSTALARGIDKTLCLQELRMGILLQNALHPGFSPFILNLMRSSSNTHTIRCKSNTWLEEYAEGEDYEFYSNAPLFEFQGLTYAEVCMYLYQRYGIVLIGIITRTEKLVAKKAAPKKKKDGTETSSTDTSSNTTTTASMSTIISSSVTKSTGSSHSTAKTSNASRDSGPSTTQPQRRTPSMAFDRDRRSLRESLDRGDRQSFDVSMDRSRMSKTGVEEMPMDDLSDEFDIVVDWDLDINPGASFVIDEKHQGIVLAKDEEDVNNITCDDVKLVQKIASRVARWTKIVTEKEQNLHYHRRAASLVNSTLPDSRSPPQDTRKRPEREEAPEGSLEDSGSSSSSSSGSSSSSSSGSDDSDVEAPLKPKKSKKSPKKSPKKQKPLRESFASSGVASDSQGEAAHSAHMYVHAHPTLTQNVQKSLKVSLSEQSSSGMVRLSHESNMRVPRELKENYELVESTPLSLDCVMLPTVEELVRDHILIVGDWLEDMYDLVIGLRSKALAPVGGLFPIVFLGSEEPDPIMWQRVSVFKDIYVVIGSQVDPRDLARAGAVDARSILVLSSNVETSEEVIKDSRSLTTFLILEKLTRAHVTIEVVTVDSLGLLLKGHAPLYSKKPPKTHPSRPEFEEARRSYKEISKLGPSSNPYFTSGNVFVSSFLDSLICLAVYNEQIVSVLSALTSPELFESVSVQRVIESYPYLVRKISKKDRRKAAEEAEAKSQRRKHHHKDDEAEMSSDSFQEGPMFKPLTFGRFFLHFIKYGAGAILLGIYRLSATDSRPYIITAPSSKLILQPTDVCFVLAPKRSFTISSYGPEEDDRNYGNGSLTEIPNARHH